MKAWDIKEWSIAHAKVSKELKPFQGTDSTYRTWASRVRDHFKEVNSDWGLVFSEIEKQPAAIPMSNQTMSQLLSDNQLVQVDFRWVSNVLWTFIGKNVSDVLYGNRSAMASGPDNGIELWRSYYVKHEGGADQVELGGIDSLHSFPQCTKVEDLGFWIGKWIEVKDQYGQGMSDIHLRSRFLNILPEAVKKDVRETKGLESLQLMINHVQKDLGRLNDLKLSKLHSDRLRQSLGQSTRVHAIIEGEEPAAVGPKQEDHFQSLINALTSKLDNIVAAVNQPRRNQATDPRGGNRQQQRKDRGPSDFAKFKGCLHCGGNHLVNDCGTKQKLLAENDGKLPAGFKSAFDKWKAKQPAKVAALNDADLQDSDQEDEDQMVWAVPCSVISSCPTGSPCNFNHSNSFADIFDQDSYGDEDDEEQMVKALSEIATVKVGPKVSQKQRCKNKPIDHRTISSIAKKVRSGHFNLPDLKLNNHKGYTASWALVDSGAGRSCAKRRGHYGNASSTLRPSSVKMATASGEELKSRGCFDMQLMTQEGNVINSTFEDADVDMPILAVTELAANGLQGSDDIFRMHDGSIVDLKKNATSRFVRRKGVYFIKVFTPNDNMSGFTRPGAA